MLLREYEQTRRVCERHSLTLYLLAYIPVTSILVHVPFTLFPQYVATWLPSDVAVKTHPIKSRAATLLFKMRWHIGKGSLQNALAGIEKESHSIP